MNRREALRWIGQATAGLTLSGGVIRGQSSDIVVAGVPVEIAIASVSPSTVRITVLPVQNGLAAQTPGTGTIVLEGQGRSVARGRDARPLSTVRAGNLRVRYTENPPTLHVDSSSGQT